jgi:hypothetical protein
MLKIKEWILLANTKRRQRYFGKGAFILTSLLLIHKSYIALRFGERKGNAKDSIAFNLSFILAIN